MTIDLVYWRNRLAAQQHSGSPHVGLTTAQFAEILDELEAGRAVAENLERELATKRRAFLKIYQCRLKNGNGTLCRSCWEMADQQQRDHTSLVWSSQ